MIDLISPSNTSVEILPNRPYDNFETKLRWSFMSLYHWGENPNGNWIVEFRIEGMQEGNNPIV